MKSLYYLCLKKRVVFFSVIFGLSEDYVQQNA